MTKIDKWDTRFLELATLVGSWSKDPSTRVGCAIIRPDRTVASVGYNGFARGVSDDGYRLHDRPTKYAFMVHAEVNAITAARKVLHDCTIYTIPFPPCSNCAGAIIQSGIKRVVAPDATAEQKERWGDSFAFTTKMFSEANVELVLA
jgi:dCMP deaminase